MRAFFIETPSVSSGLSRTYKKKLEVFEGTIENNNIKVDTIHSYGRRGWNKRSFKGHKTHSLHTYLNRHEPHDSMPTFVEIVQNPTFTTLELAQAAKLLLIERMAQKYEDELQRLRELFKRNVPDVKKPLQALKDEYPEYFI